MLSVEQIYFFSSLITSILLILTGFKINAKKEYKATFLYFISGILIFFDSIIFFYYPIIYSKVPLSILFPGIIIFFAFGVNFLIIGVSNKDDHGKLLAILGWINIIFAILIFMYKFSILICYTCSFIFSYLALIYYFGYFLFYRFSFALLVIYIL